MRSVLCSTLLFLLTSTVFAQTDRGTITGTILDPTGAVIIGAIVAAKNIETGAEYIAASTGTGNYTLSQLPVGTYELSLTKPGFKKYVRPGLVVSVAQIVQVDATLEVGQIAEIVTVQAGTPLLRTVGGELSHNVRFDQLGTLPMLTLGGGAGVLGNIRNPLAVIGLLPGAAFSSDSILRINGMPSSTQAIRIEGQDATNGLWRQQTQINQAGVGSIQEVSVQTSNFSAEYGQAGGGYFNFTMRSGTNRIHGGVFNYNVNEVYNAGTPNTNDGTGKHMKATQRRNDYGFSFGGPIYIPGIHIGKDKSFFFFSFEQFRETQIIVPAVPSTVPTAAYRNGDFRAALGLQLKKAGVPVVDPEGRPLYQNEIFKPAVRPGPHNEVMRDPFMGCDGKTMNVICQDPGSSEYFKLDDVALKIQSYFPDPLGPSANAVVNNYATPSYPNWRHTTIPSFKIDHSLSPAIKLSGYFSATITRSPGNNGFEDFVFFGGLSQDPHAYTARVNYDHTLRPTLLFHFGAGLMYLNIPQEARSFDQTKLGFKNEFFYDAFPSISIPLGAGQKGGSNLGLGAFAPYHYQREIKPTANTSLTWVKGNHTIKAGAELALEGLIASNYTRAPGMISFAPEQTGIPWELGQGMNSTTGFPYASFLLGLTNSTVIAKPTNTRLGNHSLGMFLQDTWKATRRLTLDYGLRYDLVTLLREQYGRMQNADFFKPNTVAVPLGASQGLPGMMIYEATCGGCRFGQTYKYAFGPRLGIAYQINSKTVLRAGAGISYGTSPNNSYLTLSVADFYTYSRNGYGMPATVLQDGNPWPDLTWPNFDNNYPFPSTGGLRPPASPFISIAANTGRPPRIAQWSIGLQREVARDLVVEAAYVGNRGVWWAAPLLAQENYNALTPEGLLAERMYGDTTGIDITNPADRALLTLPIYNPLVLKKFPALANPDVVYKGFPNTQLLNQALRPRPQWLGVPAFLGPPSGVTWYDSLQAKVTKRFSRGLDFQAAFTWQKELVLGANNDSSYIGTPSYTFINDVFDRRSNKQISSLSRPFVLMVSFSYTTPKIGFSNKGLKILSQAMRDWTLGGVLRYQSGELIFTPGSNNQFLSQLARGQENALAFWGGGVTRWNRNPGVPVFKVDPNCHCFDPAQMLVLNPAAWTDAPAGQFGKSAPYFNDIRWQRQPAEALSLGRIFRIQEAVSLQIRIELQNIFNRVFLSAPNPTVMANPSAPTTRYPDGTLSGGFGYVNTYGGTGMRPRTGQIVMRLSF